jgi:glycosyltransferase involved in cell wall biosynthesis
MSVPSRPKILLLIPHLGGGGAEQVIALLARSLSAEKYETHLGLVTQADALPGAMPSWVSIHCLGATRVRAGAFRLHRLVRQVKPDVILSGMFHLNFLVLLLRRLLPRGTRVVVRQNGTITAALAFGNLPWYTRLLYRMLYCHAHRVICQSLAMAKELSEELEIPGERLIVLPNPVDVDAIRAESSRCADSYPGPGPHLLAVGRLSREKGYDLLLRALAAAHEQFPDAHLTIAGAGPEEASLQALCRELGIERSVRFAGYVDNPAVFFHDATAFVLSSRHEGMPNALLEAAAAGMPIVALPASQGVVDLLRNQPGAWLGGEVSSEALAVSMLDALKALSPGQRFDHSFIDGFRIDHAIAAYENLIDVVLNEKLAHRRL